jgi:hypothetical protein
VKRRSTFFAALVSAGTLLLGTGCKNAASPSSASSEPASELFIGSLDVGSSRFYAFNVTAAGTTQITLVSLGTGPSGASINVPMRISVGVPNGIGCDLTESLDVSPALVTQLTIALAAGTYCTQLSDIGHLTTAVSFAVRISHS